MLAKVSDEHQGPASEFAENSRIYGLAMATGYLVQARREEVERWWTIAPRNAGPVPELTGSNKTGGLPLLAGPLMPPVDGRRRLYHTL